MIDYYKILGLKQTATADEIRLAYRNLAKRYHPDNNKSPEAPDIFIQIQQAYDNLGDPKKRAEFDQHYFNFQEILRNKPRLIVKPSTLNFGPVYQNDTRRMYFEIHNIGGPVGADVLVIDDSAINPWASVTKATPLGDIGDFPLRVETELNTNVNDGTYTGDINIKLGKNIETVINVTTTILFTSGFKNLRIKLASSISRLYKLIGPEVGEIVMQLLISVVTFTLMKREIDVRKKYGRTLDSSSESWTKGFSEPYDSGYARRMLRYIEIISASGSRTIKLSSRIKDKLREYREE